MKTPREILFEQHEAARPKLDAIRASVVAGLPRSEAFSWREMARSLRWHLAGMGAAWVVVLALNFSSSSGRDKMIAADQAPTPKQLWASIRENRRLLLEYTDPPVAEPAEPPGRRSQLEIQRVMV